MKIYPLIALLILFGHLAFSQTGARYADDALYASNHETQAPASSNEQRVEVSVELFLEASQLDNAGMVSDFAISFDELVAKMERKQQRYRRDVDFLNYLFYKVHNKYLKQYEQYVSFGDVMANGKYDCLTGTAFYGLLLDQLGYSFRIHETNYHIVLLINLPEGQVMFESTDYAHGFLKDAEKISERLSLHTSNNTQGGEDLLVFENNANHMIGLRQLAGLQYYNLAIKAFNVQDFASAHAQIEKAVTLYDSPRVREFARVVQKILQNTDALTLNY